MHQKTPKKRTALRRVLHLLLACLILLTMLPLAASAQNTALYTTSTGLTITRDGSVFDSDGGMVLAGNGVLDPAKVNAKLLDDADPMAGGKNQELNGKAGVEYIYRWKLVNTQAEFNDTNVIPNGNTINDKVTVPCLLGWYTGGNYYYLTRPDYDRYEYYYNSLTGNYTKNTFKSEYGNKENFGGWYHQWLKDNRSQHDYDWISMPNETFDTRGNYGCASVFKHGSVVNFVWSGATLGGAATGENAFSSNQPCLEWKRKYGDCAFFTIDLEYSTDPNAGKDWTPVFSDTGGSGDTKKYSDKVENSGKCIFYQARSSADDNSLQYSGNRLSVYTDDTYDYDEFYLYVGKTIALTAIDSDLTVESGKVMNVKDRYVLEEGCTLTVAPGAVLSIEGNFYNNGTIENYGTILVQDGGCISALEPELSKSNEHNRIICHSPTESVTNLGNTYTGGECAVIVLSGGRIIGYHGSQTLKMMSGSTLENFGIMVLPRGLDATDSRIHNRASGSMFLGYHFASSQGGAPTAALNNSGSASTMTMTGLAKMSAGSVNGVHSGCVIQNEGKVRASFITSASDAIALSKWGGSTSDK